MSEDISKKVITKEQLDHFFKTVNIDVESIINERNKSRDNSFVNTSKKENCQDGSCGCSDKESGGSLPKEAKGPNILYLTTSCNLACEYCYEKNERDELEFQKVMSKEELSKALELIYQKWSGSRSSPETVVIFGGEPLLVPDSLKFILDRSLELGKAAFAFCLTSNGIWFLKEENVLKYKEWTKGRSISLEISWDGSGNFRRVYKNKESAEKHINQALDNLAKNNVPVTLRYTIHSGNYDKVIQDYIYALERWSNVKKIQNSYDFTGLDTAVPGMGWKELIYGKLNYREYFRALWNRYEIPLCQEVCDLCDYCDRSLTAVNYFVPDKEVLVQELDDKGQLQSRPFDHWLKK